jgi:prophage regulatory protein
MKLLAYDDLRPSKGIRYSKVQLWRLEKAGKFPKRIPLGPARHGWSEDEIDAWIASKIAERDASHKGAAARMHSANPAKPTTPRAVHGPRSPDQLSGAGVEPGTAQKTKYSRPLVTPKLGEPASPIGGDVAAGRRTRGLS